MVKCVWIFKYKCTIDKICGLLKLKNILKYLSIIQTWVYRNKIVFVYFNKLGNLFGFLELKTFIKKMHNYKSKFYNWHFDADSCYPYGWRIYILYGTIQIVWRLICKIFKL